MIKMIFMVSGLLMAVLAHSASWEDVRIVATLPNEDCVFKEQQVCKWDSVDCLKWFKGKAADIGANAITLPVSALPYALADYYYCPNLGPEQI